MRKSLCAGVAAAVACGSATALAVPLAQAAPQQLSFVSVTKKMVNVPTGFILDDIDYNAAGAVIGSDAVNCRAHTTPPCVLSVALAGGSLYLSIVPSETAIHGQVVAGTGKYKGASGTVTGGDVSEAKTDVTVTFKTV